ncbi:glycolipid 2-alpha-mannosyltransferase [Colletotrichum orchidophilum]|uniref:Glycolipid 2-alpha-mannosyltransferase n=1 Tax=Colletotrichum orchidophilum TaxID=1209926 RepID=A0A1G4BA18_9PEZI|nr:glycolipid 2-alpha-mannosyltransferase [Colletotrichum orchidophilum]OHE98250.1 glycolipid 2-alpha-mannosyltransferase [Colletotrichum orchidophilum]
MAAHSQSSLRSCAFFVFCIALALFQLPLALCGPIHIRDDSPRAALVSLVSEQQREQMVASVAQLEQRFNHKYRYDWVFFSHQELSEEFKDATSNATASTVTYNLIPQQHWTIPSSVDPGRFEAGLRRWSAGLFAREKRLQAYEWFWMIEPGTKFLCDITVDVFRLMRDRGISYGVNEISFEGAADSELLWQSTKSFMDKHPDLVRPTADITWILGDIAKPNKPTRSSDYYVDDGTDYTESVDLDLQTGNCRTSGQETEGGMPPGTCLEADPQQCEPNTVADAFTTRLAARYDQCNMDTPIEIGSLNHFRGPEHSSYFDYLDNAGDFYYGNTGNVPVHSLSASMFLPRDKFWLLGDMVCEMHGLHSCPPMPHPTSDLQTGNNPNFFADIIGTSWFGACEDNQVLLIHRVWEKMASEMARQNGIPAAQLGHTALDERNFKLYMPERYPVDVTLTWYSLEDSWRSWSCDRLKWFLGVLGW